jgi:hypothetical protein
MFSNFSKLHGQPSAEVVHLVLKFASHSQFICHWSLCLCLSGYHVPKPLKAVVSLREVNIDID